MISYGNGVLLEMEGHRFRFDPRRVQPDEVGMISHAHSDHLPSSFRKSAAICSPITRDFVKVRKRKEIVIESDERVKLLEAGHIAGSNMFMVLGEKRVLYTGDFCTRLKEHTEPARPRRCDILITEATYGKPRYVFPAHEETMASVKDWLEDLAGRSGSAVLLAYPLGKAQELAATLRDLPLFFDPVIAGNNRVLNKHGYALSDAESDGSGLEPPFVYVTSGLGKNRARIAAMRKRGTKTATFSGWALDRGPVFRSSVDEAFPISDHCGFDELIRFVRQCAPEKVFTLHGFAREFATEVRRELGIHAQPLIARQKTLDHFC